MAGLIKAVGRLVVMALVVVVVVATSIYAGLAATVAVGLAIVLAGIVGMAGTVRRRRAPELVAVPVEHPAVVAMAPESAVAAAAIDPEALMPRWRRPSLIAARRNDPSRSGLTERAPMRFRPDTAPTTAELRIVRYAVVPLLDRPDEVLGFQLMDLIAGDEVQVTESTGSFWEVVCPDGERGWVHRTTLGLPGAFVAIEHEPVGQERTKPGDVDDVLTALLAARGLN
jgi:hypothetical protein